MEKYKKYYGIAIFIAVILIIGFAGGSFTAKMVNTYQTSKTDLESVTNENEQLKQKKQNLINKLQKLRNSLNTAVKKVYYPTESALDNDTLFFTLYNDVIELIQSNSVTIKSIDYTYAPEEDLFVKLGKDKYFVCDVNMELLSNYTNLNKAIQDIYQYPYYIKINSIDIEPHSKDKKVLLTTLNLRLYAHTDVEPNENESTNALKELNKQN